MRVYTVHAPSDDAEAAERAVFIKEGISWPALIVPPLWVLWHRLWLALLGWLVFLVLVAAVGRLLGDSQAAALAIIGWILFALEANNIRRGSLARRGWREIGETFGRNRGEAEIRFFYGQAESPAAQPAPAAASRPSFPTLQGLPEHNVIGLFPEAER